MRNSFICFLGSEILVVPSHFIGPQDWPAFDDTLSGPLYKSNTTNCCSLDESISAQRISSERSPLLDIILAFLLLCVLGCFKVSYNIYIRHRPLKPNIARLPWGMETSSKSGGFMNYIVRPTRPQRLSKYTPTDRPVPRG